MAALSIFLAQTLFSLRGSLGQLFLKSCGSRSPCSPLTTSCPPQPTNHLDLDTAVALAAALESFEGGVVLASHDRALMRRVAEQFLVVKDGKLKKQRHGLGGYLEALEEAYFS